MQQQHRVTGRGRWVLAPLVLVGLLAAAWSGVWLYGARQAEARIAEWLARETQAGRAYGCGSRTFGGYPFRIEMRCSEPRAEVRRGDDSLVLQGRTLSAVAQVYGPELVIAEVTGPVTIASGSGAPDYTADWSLLQFSLRGLPWAFERMSLVLDGPKLQRAGVADPMLRAKRFELHVRLNAETVLNSQIFDLAAIASAVVIEGVPRLGPRPIDAEATAVLRGVTDLAPKPLPDRLRAWQAAGGKLELTNARFTQGDAVAVIKGGVGLTPQARLDGAFQVSLAGLEQLVGQLLGGESPRAQAGILTALTLFGGRQELEGKRAISAPLRLKDGGVFFGPLQLGQTPPLY